MKYDLLIKCKSKLLLWTPFNLFFSKSNLNRNPTRINLLHSFSNNVTTLINFPSFYFFLYLQNKTMDTHQAYQCRTPKRVDIERQWQRKVKEIGKSSILCNLFRSYY